MAVQAESKSQSESDKQNRTVKSLVSEHCSGGNKKGFTETDLREAEGLKKFFAAAASLLL